MRFYGIPSEDRVAEIVEMMKEETWIYEDLQEGVRERLSLEKTKEKLMELIRTVKGWKESNKHIPSATTFFFVHTPSDPKAFKVYDLSSLGCSSSLSPARWLIYREGLEIR